MGQMTEMSQRKKNPRFPEKRFPEKRNFLKKENQISIWSDQRRG